MRVFISWSKRESAELARALRTWLPEVIQTLEPWMSQEDIAKGQRWGVEISTQLESSGQGLICVTRANVTEPWLNFEAGALAKSLSDARVRPVLLHLQPHEVTGPLAQFQATEATNREDMFRLVGSLNDALESPLDGVRLERAFDRSWGDFAEGVSSIEAAAGDGRAPQRSVPDVLAEVLDRVRTIERSIIRPRGKQSSPQRFRNDYQFEAGQAVEHAAFGLGVVTAVWGDGDERMVSVDFAEGVGLKQLVSRYAPMHPVDPPF